MSPEVPKSADDDCVEAEIVAGPGAAPRRGPSRHGGAPLYAFFQRIRALLSVLVVLAGFALMLLGAVLTSTVIGAFLGLPLLALGILCLWFVFKFLAADRKDGPVVFRRF